MRSFLKLFIVGVLLFSCGEENSPDEDCTEAYCPFVGVWHLDELSADGDPVSDDLSEYQLDLRQPVSGTGQYQRTLTSGETETGTWSVGNNGTVISLDTPDGNEDYLVESVGLSSLVLIIEREDTKPGPEQFRFVFSK